MIGFELETSFAQCPKHWQNFIRHIQKNQWEDVPAYRINRMLKPYYGRYRFFGSRYKPSVEFESDEALMMFILRWS